MARVDQSAMFELRFSSGAPLLKIVGFILLKVRSLAVRRSDCHAARFWFDINQPFALVFILDSSKTAARYWSQDTLWDVHWISTVFTPTILILLIDVCIFHVYVKSHVRQNIIFLLILLE